MHHHHHQRDFRNYHELRGLMASREQDPRGFMAHRGHEHFFKGRKFSSDEIQLFILHFLSDKPNYGYELIKLFTEKSNGFYTPSPGVIYPALTYLEEVGRITVTAEGTRKQYSLAESGRAFLSEHETTIANIMDKFKRLAERMDSVRDAIHGNPHENGFITELRENLHRLRHLLHSMSHLDEKEQQQIANLVKTLTDEISIILKKDTA